MEATATLEGWRGGRRVKFQCIWRLNRSIPPSAVRIDSRMILETIEKGNMFDESSV